MIWKAKLNKILHDKNDYHLDPVLKRDAEIAEELLQNTIKYQKYLIPRKIRYFFKYDKSFFWKLFIRIFWKFLIILIVLGIISSLLYFFGLETVIKKAPKQINYIQCPIYIPSTGNASKDSLNIVLYKKIFKDATYIIFYPEDNSKNYQKWKQDLQGIESNDWPNPYEARRQNSQYWGKYQFSGSARAAVGLDEFSWEQWKNNPDLQEAALKMWVEILYQELNSDIKKYDGKFLNGWAITESGIIAMAHNVGAGATKQFLYSDGKIVPKDGSGKDATRFLILGNYDLEIK